jgi:hypothetical protein
MTKRKKKPISQAEQSRRLLQSAGKAGVGERSNSKTLEKVMREVRLPQLKASTKSRQR